MLRLAFTFILLLLMLFGGAVWLLDLSPPSPTPERQAPERQAKEQPADKDQGEVDALSEALKATAPPADGAPSFDIARIDPNGGVSTFAGRAEPRSLVTITIDGQEIGTAAADDNGEWTLTTDAKIANPDGKLALFKAPPGSVARVIGAEPQTAQAKAAASPAVDKPKTAQAVTSNMLKSLEGMVAEARTDDQKSSAAPAASPSASPAASPPASAASSTPSAPSTTVATAPANTSPPAATAPPPVPGSAVGQSTTVPVPVTFVFNEATLTDDGKKAASLLLEYLRLKRFPRITLTGHADERGSDELNLGLSRERLETVARFLRDGGFNGQLQLVPKGKAEPYTGVVRGDFSQEDLWQLDRRVELVVSRR